MKHFFLSLLLALPLLLAGQSDTSYQRFIEAGNQLVADTEYRKAQTQFNAARVQATSPVQRARATELLNQALDKEKRELEELRLASQRQGRQEEAWRMRPLSILAREEGNSNTALYLAFAAKTLLDSLPSSAPDLPTEHAFGEAVGQTLLQRFCESCGTIDSYRQLSWDDNKVVLKLQNSALMVVDLSTEQHTELSPPNTSKLSAMAFAHSDPFLFLGYDNNEAVVIDMAGDRPPEARRPITPHTEATVFAVIAPNDDFILSCSRDDQAKLWDAHANLIAPLTGHAGNIYGSAFSPDGQHLLTRSADHTVRIWDYKGWQVAKFDQHTNYVYSARFSDDGQLVVTASADATAKLWKPSGELVADLARHQDVVKDAWFINEGRNILTHGLDRNLMTWDRSGKHLATLSHPVQVSSLCYLPDKSRLITGMASGSLRLWGTNGQQIWHLDQAHSNEITAIDYSPVAERFVTTCRDGAAKVWTLEGNLLMTLSTKVPATFTSDGQYILTLDDEGLNRCPIPAVAYKLLRENLLDYFSETEQNQYWKEYGMRFFSQFAKSAFLIK